MALSRNRALIFLCLALLLLAAWSVRFCQTYKPKPSSEHFVIIRGIIADNPKPYYDSKSFHVNGILVTAKLPSDTDYGDYVTIAGVQTKQGSIVNGRVELLVPGNGNVIIDKLNQLKSALLPIPFRFLPHRQASLVSGLVLGEKRNGDRLFLDDLRKTGTIHIIVVSGANLSMVAAVFFRSKRLFGLKGSIALSFGIVWFYALLSGAQPPVIRAAIMVSLAYFARIFGRQTWDLYALCIAGAIMLLLNPQLILDISFQLSFAATLGIIVFTKPLTLFFREGRLPIVGPLLKKAPAILVDNLVTTLAAQILVTPIILYHFNQLSLLSPIVNMLVLPVVPYLTIVGGLLLFVGYFSDTLGSIVSYFFLLPATYFSKVIELFAKVPFISISLFGFSLYYVAAYYLYIIVIATLPKARCKASATMKFATIEA